MRILLVAPSLPYPPMTGFETRVFHLLRHLAARQRVTLLTHARADQADEIAALASLGVMVEPVIYTEHSVGIAGRRRAQLVSLLSTASFRMRNMRSPAMQAALDRLLATARFDLIQVESSLMAGLSFGTATPVLVDEHNVEYELLHRIFRTESSPARKLYGWVEFAKFRREEQRCWARMSGGIMTSAREAAMVRQHLPEKPLAVVPNGVDIEYFRPMPVARDPTSIVFTGLMSYRPNVDAVIHFVRDILPGILRVRPDLVLTIVGRSVPEAMWRLAGPNVVVTGRVADVRPHLARASAVVVPLRMGGGTRLKVLEALAMGKPLVSTRIGCEGIAARDGEHLLVADDPDAFGSAVLRLLDDRALASGLGVAGKRLVERKYSWSLVGERLEAFHAAFVPAGRAEQGVAVVRAAHHAVSPTRALGG